MPVVLTLPTIMRILSAGIFAYDFLLTLPSERRLYQRQPSLLLLTPACKLFIAARYMGMIAVTVATMTFFGVGDCGHMIYFAGSTRAILSSITALILLWRTWNIWGRSRIILILMSVAFIPTTIFSYGFLFDTGPNQQGGTCTALSGPSPFGKQWIFAFVHLLFDLLACGLSSWRLVRNIVDTRDVSTISRTLLADGIGYFLIVATGHMLNMIFLLTASSINRPSFLTFNVTMTSIACQRMITSLSERRTASGSLPSTRSPLDAPPHPLGAARARASKALVRAGTAPASPTSRKGRYPPPPAPPALPEDMQLAKLKKSASRTSVGTDEDEDVKPQKGGLRATIELMSRQGGRTNAGGRMVVGVHTETSVVGDDASVFERKRESYEGGK